MATATKKTTTKRTAKAPAKTAGIGEDAFKTAEDMTDAAREQFETVMTSFTGNLDDMREQAEEFAGAFQERAKKTQDHLTDVNTNLVDAMREEVTEAVQFANDIAKAKTFADALEIQREYWTNLFETRMDRTREMTEASVEMARETMSPFDAKFVNAFETPNFSFEKLFPFATKA